MVAHDVDLALLRVREASFSAGAARTRIGNLPAIQDEVTVVGYPAGGESVSYTEGIVSRVEFTESPHSFKNVFTVQVDAAINPGNSGGPVLNGEEIVGIAAAVLRNADNIGYIVPAPALKQFVEDAKDGVYSGLPELGVCYQKLENPSFCKALGLSPNQHGVRVSEVPYGSAAYGVLQEDDIIVEIEGVAIAGDGTIPFVDNKRIHMSYLIALKQVGDPVSLKVLRTGVNMDKRLVLRSNTNAMLHPQYDTSPSYYMIGGFVFMPLTLNDLLGDEETPGNLRYVAQYRSPTADQQQVVMLTYVLVDESNRGYHDFKNQLVKSVNGRPVKDLPDFISAVGEICGQDGSNFL